MTPTDSTSHELERAESTRKRMMLNSNGNGFRKTRMAVIEESSAARLLHPAWRAFVRYCAELQHGEIEVLKIQDGLPVLAEVTKKKVKFAP